LTRRLLLLLLACLFVAAATAAPLLPVARTEIDALLSRLEALGCEFNRNGTWYTGAEAKPHLLRKLKYLEDRAPYRRPSSSSSWPRRRAACWASPTW
jgi:hypothetical protein